MAITVAFLYFRAIELSLKAAIVERHLASPSAIPSRQLGHTDMVSVGIGGGNHRQPAAVEVRYQVQTTAKIEVIQTGEIAEPSRVSEHRNHVPQIRPVPVR